MKAFISKLKSRKFLSCAAGVILGVSMIFGLDEGVINTIAGAITSVSSIVIYIYTEGKIDAAVAGGVQEAAKQIKDAAEAVEGIEE